MPDALADVVRSWTGACLAGIASDGVVPRVVFEEPDCAREEAGGYEVEEASADYQEDLELRCVATAGNASAIVNSLRTTHEKLTDRSNTQPHTQLPNHK